MSGRCVEQSSPLSLLSVSSASSLEATSREEDHCSGCTEERYCLLQLGCLYVSEELRGGERETGGCSALAWPLLLLSLSPTVSLSGLLKIEAIISALMFDCGI